MAHKTELLNTCTGPPDSLGGHTPSNQIPFDTPYNNFCKYVLGMAKYASTTAVLSEPLRNKVTLNAISYWHKMELGNIRCLLYQADQECKSNLRPFFMSICPTI